MGLYSIYELRCDELRQLSDGWDGPHSKRPTEPALTAAESILDEVSITPHGSGGVMIGVGGFTVLYVGPDGTIEEST